MSQEQIVNEQIPETVYISFARIFLPQIKQYFESDKGKREFAEWQNAIEKSVSETVGK